MDYQLRLVTKIVKAAKGQRNALFFVSRKMNLINDLLAIPSIVTTAIMGSTLLSSHAQDQTWVRYMCACIAFVNVLIITLQRVSRPGELGETYQTYGRKWEMFATNTLSAVKWSVPSTDSGAVPTQALIEKYNIMVEQTPLLPQWALAKFKQCNDGLSSDEDEEPVPHVMVHVPGRISSPPRIATQTTPRSSHEISCPLNWPRRSAELVANRPVTEI